MNKLVYALVLAIAAPSLTGCATAVVGGAATGTAIAVDRRTAGVFVSDQEIELRAMSRLRETFPQGTESIATTSYNRQVLLTGQVPDEAARARGRSGEGHSGRAHGIQRARHFRCHLVHLQRQ